MDRREFLGCAGCAGVATLMGCGTPRAASGGPSAVRPEDFSYCGIDCAACDVYKATVHGDRDARQRAAKLWAQTAKEHWHMETLDPAILDCRGCRVSEVQHQGHGRCPMRPCARKRELASCGLCPEWETCGKLSGVLTDEPQARANLQRVAAAAKAPPRAG